MRSAIIAGIVCGVSLYLVLCISPWFGLIIGLPLLLATGPLKRSSH